mgnify:FL=1
MASTEAVATNSLSASAVYLKLECLVMSYLSYVGNRHVTDGSLDFYQRKDVFHQLCHFGAYGLTSFFDFLEKKTVNFSHSATSQRSDFRYSVFEFILITQLFYQML